MTNSVFTKNQKKIYALGTCINLLIGLFYADPYIFLIRQFFLTVFVVVFAFFKEDLDLVREDLNFIQQGLIRKSRIFYYEEVLYFFFIIAVFISSSKLPSSYEGLYFLTGIYTLFMFFFAFYRLYCICTTPELRVHFQSPRIGLTRNLARSSFFVKGCVECLKIAGVSLGVFVGGGYGLPKALFGANYRSPLINFAGYLVTGLKSSNDAVYSGAVEYLSEYPSVPKSLITEDDGVTVSKKNFTIT